MDGLVELSVEQSHEAITCSKCGVTFSLPSTFVAGLRNSHDTFYCPNGHPQYFPGETEAERLRKQLEEKERQLQFERQRATTNYEQRQKAEKRVRSLEKRASAGVCPCCKRTFQQVARHMKTKHPEFAKKED